MAKTTLDANEFAIENNAKFLFDPSGTNVTINANRTVTITLTYTSDENAKIQTTPGDITIGDCGIFKSEITNAFKKDLNLLPLRISTPTTNQQVQLISDNNDVKLLTNGEKGRQLNRMRTESAK